MKNIADNTINDDKKVSVKESLSNDEYANEKFFVETSITEYKELRTELREVMSRQSSVLLSTITQFVALGSLGTAVLSVSEEIIKNSKLWVGGLFYFVIPCLTILLGIIWMDLAYRQVSIASYIYLIEEQIIDIIHNEDSDYLNRKVLYWEHFIDKKNKINPFTNINMWSYICSVIVYIVLPVALVLITCFNDLCTWNNWYYITVAFFSIFIFFIIWYCIKMVKTYKEYKTK
ncbi:MAG: hypothetical protein E7561_03615 [Ruminococcaceae bacterium]|nr:hypothetical protein [Oscillospiraceae bacterium]